MVKTCLVLFLFSIPALVISQQENGDEIQVNFNTYFDNFRLTVIYPSIGITKSIDSKTSITGSYLMDAISSATMKMTFKVDGITSATENKQGGGDDTPDELRHQLNIGVSRDVLGATFSADGMFSTEHDYSSATFAANAILPFAKKNTIIQLGYVGNRDKVFPQTRTWTKNRNTNTFNIGLTQIISKSIISQLDFSFINMNGYMLDGYQVVRIISSSTISTLEPVEPDKRLRKAAGVRLNFGLTKISTLMLGYRYYWDTWDINSNTFDIEYKTHINKSLNISIGLRQYLQTKAYFFKPEYTMPEQFMAVDGKLNSGYTNQITFDLSYKGSNKLDIPIINNDNVTFISTFGFFHRHTDSPDWATRVKELYAYLISLGFKISI